MPGCLSGHGLIRKSWVREYNERTTKHHCRIDPTVHEAMATMAAT